jgi:SNF2 family DNA or RNA helicase
LIRRFIAECRAVQSVRGTALAIVSEAEINGRLETMGFTKHPLTLAQRRDVKKLLALPNGANFSVPGSGKTTVALALYLLTRSVETFLVVVGPKNCFGAWQAVLADFLDDTAAPEVRAPFVVLEGRDNIAELLRSGAQKFLLSYDQMIRVVPLFAEFLSRQRTHLVLDESHRMKAGPLSQRGSALLGLAALPVRRDILSGTPMPQSPQDLQSQLDFLWPGSGLGLRIAQGGTPNLVIGDLYVRTTKSELDLPPAGRKYLSVGMNPAHLAFYSILRNEALRQLSEFRTSGRGDIIQARHCVMRLLQASSNPMLAMAAIADSVPAASLPQIAKAVYEEGPALKLIEAVKLARDLAAKGRKAVIWTIFTDTIVQLERELIDLNPVTLHGGVPVGDVADPFTREGKIRRFHEDPSCSVVIANPAAASEGISLHKVCHDAIYLDRSYNATHYLQSIDRIHRLGLPSDVVTTSHILLLKTPPGIGSIDYSVSRRLGSKIRAMQVLFNDKDLHELAYDEENAPLPLDDEIKFEDLVDLVEELEGRKVFDEMDAE